jgi:hypothetical protein
MEKRFFKQQTNKKKLARVKITLKLSKNGEATHSYHTSKVKRIYPILRQANFSEAFLKADYGEGFTNSGIYTNKRDLVFALKAFTEKSLVEELQNG